MIDFVTQFQDYMRPTGSSERFVIWSALAGIAAALERKVWLDKYGGSQDFASMYVTLVGHPGCGKSFTSGYMESIITDMNHKAKVFEKKGVTFAPRILTPAALIQRFAKAFHKEDTGYVHSSLFSYCDELSQFIEDIGGGTLGKDLLVYFDCKKRIDKSLVSSADIEIVNQYLTALWGTTPFYLKRYLAKEVSGEGLSSRMLFATDLRKHSFQRRPPQPPSHMRKTLVDTLFQIYLLNGPMEETEAAANMLDRWYLAWDQLRKTLVGGGPWVQYIARKATYVQKVSMCLAASRLSMKIEEEDIRLAIQLLDDFEPDMRNAFGVQDVTGDRDALWQFLEFVPYEGIYEDILFQSMVQTGIMFSKDNRFQAYLDSLQTSGHLQISQRNGKVYYRRLL